MNTHRRRQQGMSLVELMIALLIGLVIIFGATTVYNRSRQTYGESEAIARLQETARYAMSIIEPDVRMSNYFGLIKGASGFSGLVAAQSDVPPGGAPANICGNNFAIDLNTNLQADNDTYNLSLNNTRQAACDALPDLNTGTVWTTSAQATSDTLTVRRASVAPAVATNGVLQICSTRTTATVFSNASACAAAPNAQLNNVIVNTYYIDRRSQQSTTLPSLHRKVLTTAGGAVTFADQEVIAGVEDMQVQFGIDTNQTGVATRYIDPPVGGLPAGSQVVAVRIWLLVRADAGEGGFIDSQIYAYGDRLAATGITGNLSAAGAQGFAYQPSLSVDDTLTGPRHVRRLLISRTIQIRNALGT